jgi:hypothetical protein
MSARVPIRTELAAIAVVEALLEAETGVTQAPVKGFLKPHSTTRGEKSPALLEEP